MRPSSADLKVVRRLTWAAIVPWIALTLLLPLAR